jgi:hypothetical protein
MCRAGGGLSNGSTFCFGVASCCFGTGFLAREGQKRNWNYVCKLSVYYSFGKNIPTGTPVDVRIIASSDGENNKLELALAASNLALTRLERASDSPRRILIDCLAC